MTRRSKKSSPAKAPGSAKKAHAKRKTTLNVKPVKPKIHRRRVEVIPAKVITLPSESSLQDEAEKLLTTLKIMTSQVEALSKAAAGVRASAGAIANFPTDVVRGYIHLSDAERQQVDDLIRTMDMRRVQPNAAALGVLVRRKLTPEEESRRERRRTRSNSTLIQQVLESEK